jgi:predicted kinase
MAAAGSSPVLILTGPPGVGKTTAAGILAERSMAAVHLEADTFFRFIRSGYVEPWKPESHDQNRLVMGIVADAAAAYANAAYFTIIDGIVIPRWFLDPLREGLHAAGLEVAYAVARAPLPVCTARLQEREGLLGDPDVIGRLWSEFADLGALERNAVDVAGMSPEQVADAISRLLEEGRLAV